MENEEIEIAWLAGLLEGEGSFGCSTSQGKGLRKYKYTYFRISLITTDEDIARRAARVMENVKVYGPYTRKNRPTRKPWFAVYATGHSANRIATKIIGFMGERRRQQISEALVAWQINSSKKREHKKRPDCHPDRPYRSNGLCWECFNEMRRDRNAQAASEILPALG